MNENELRDDLELAIGAVREAGAMAQSHFGAVNASWTKSPGQPVSHVDLEADRILSRHLLAARPGYGWLSEESPASANRETAHRVWMVDPIDGTRAFLEGRAEYSVSAALVADGKPVLGVVFNPATDELFAAARGMGAHCNGQPIRVGRHAAPEGSRILVSRNEFKALATGGELFDCTVGSISSIAYKIALVAKGQADAAVTLLAKSDWDIAAAQLILQEAGGIMTQLDGASLIYNRPKPRHGDLLAANPVLHEALLARFKRR